MRRAASSPSFLPPALLGLALLAAAASAQNPLNAQHALFQHPGGYDVAPAGDVNGDGRADVIVGLWGDVARVYSGADGSLLHSFPSAPGSPPIAWSVSGVGDVDGDGVPDLAAGGSEADANGPEAGVVLVFSGATGATLHAKAGDASGDRLGASVAAAGDANGDGFADVAAGACAVDYPIEPQNYARVYSGKSGATLFTVLGSATQGDKLGFSVASVGDLDSDGRPELAIGAPMHGQNGTSAQMRGAVFVHSGLDGHRLFTFLGDSSMDFLGYSVAGLGDVNGDAVPDLVAGAWGDDNQGDVSGSARIFSGKTGAVLATVSGDVAGDRLGVGVGGLGDVDGDGHADFLAGIPYSNVAAFNAGALRVYSGLRKAPIRTLFGSLAFESFGWAARGLGDVNGDGSPDFATNSQVKGHSIVLSGVPMPLAAAEHEISLAAGGAQHWSLDGGAGQAAFVYGILGTASGTSPGLQVGALHVPLNVDDYTAFSAGSANAAPFFDTVGALDGVGRAQARFEIPPGLPASLAGLKLHHAFLSIDLSTGAIALVSNAVPLTLVP